MTMQVLRVNDYEDPRLDPYRELKLSNPTRWSEGFIAEGRFVVERLLNSKLEISSVLVSEKRFPNFATRIRRGVSVLVVPHELASRLVGFDFHAGVIAHGRRPSSFFSGKNSERFDGWVQSTGHCTLVACPNTTLPDNLGSIIRLSAAFGVHGLIVTPQSADPFSRRCVRVSMGNIFQLPAFETDRLLDDFDLFKKKGFQIVGCHQSQQSVDARKYSWPNRVVMVLGNEATGIPEEIQQACDQHLEIPIASHIDSLNVSTAAAILLYEQSRQRLSL
jgi:tRNA G18 (ribose-2'-O)-methylase SpoU